MGTFYKMEEVNEAMKSMEVDAPEDMDDELLQSVLKTSQFFTSMIELIPAKFYINQEAEDGEQETWKGKKKRKKPDDKKLLAKKAKLLKLDPSKHKSVEELQSEVEKKEKELYSQTTEPDASTTVKPINVSNVE